MYSIRAMAFLVDLMILKFIAFSPILVAVFYCPNDLKSPVGQPPTLMLSFLLTWVMLVMLCYMPIFESSRLMATPGKLLFGLKVSLPNGNRLTFAQAFYRMAGGPLYAWFLSSQREKLSGGAVVTFR